MTNIKKKGVQRMLRKILMIVLFVMLFRLIGHFDMQNEISTLDYDRQNKQEFIKDFQMRCLQNELNNEYCKGY